MPRPDAPTEASDLHAALLRYSAEERAGADEGPLAETVRRELELRSAAFPPPEEAASGRRYRVGEVARLLAICAGAMLVLDSEGLALWAERLSVGRAQDVWLAVLRPLHEGFDRAHLTYPRRRMVQLGSASATALFGAQEDPLLVRGWTKVEPDPAVLEAAPSPALPVPLTEAPAQALARAPPGSEISVLLLGDSLIAGSLGSALRGALGRRPLLRVVSSFQVATGLNRPEVFDWMKVVPPLLERERPALVICSLGANDASDLREGERRWAFGEPGWRQVYRARVLAMMRVLSGSGARVLWLGLPPMRERWYSGRAQTLNRLYEEAARKVPGVDFLDLDMLVSGPDRGFATFGREGNGRLVRIRLDDGVHYAPAGAAAISRWVMDWAQERLRRQRPSAR